MPLPTVTDVVVVGGGAAGGALAASLAAAGRGVMVLEATESFTDRVRGESMMPWGVAEARRLGVVEILHDAGAHVAPTWRRYAEGRAEPREIPVGSLVPGVEGTLNLEHRRACQALLDAAASAGAAVVRGVRHVEVEPGPNPSVSFNVGAQLRRCTPSVVVGADGRGSVVRRACGIRLEHQAATGFVVGMLLDDVEGPADHDVLAEHDLGLFLLLRQRAGRARAYHVVSSEHRNRYAGNGGPERFLRDALAVNDHVARALVCARPAGPCGAIAGTDTWTERPMTDGVVLIGDAAGHNDPTAGCGLSIAMRDARTISELLLEGARGGRDFTPYATERSERMRRLRLSADLVNAASVEAASNRSARRAHFAAAMAEMDAQIFPLVLAMFAGPETVPSALVDDAVLERIRAA